MAEVDWLVAEGVVDEDGEAAASVPEAVGADDGEIGEFWIR